MENITLSGPGLKLSFENANGHLRLVQMQCNQDHVILCKDGGRREEGPGPVGNPLTLVIREGIHAGVYGMDALDVSSIRHTGRSLTAHLTHTIVPVQVLFEVEAEGSVSTWRGQVCWTGSEYVEMDVYFPFFSRVFFGGPSEDRAILAHMAGSVHELHKVNFHQCYMGQTSSPVFLVEGKGRGLAVLDDNRADFAPDPGACVRRSHVVGNNFSVISRGAWSVYNEIPETGGGDGPFVGICNSRRFAPVDQFDFISSESMSNQKEIHSDWLWNGDYADLGPVSIYAYSGTWKTGASWLRSRRRQAPFRVSPADWYKKATFLSEHGCFDLLKKGGSFFQLPEILEEKKSLGSELFFVVGFHDPVKFGTTNNGVNRGDYYFAAQNLGGFEAVRNGVETVHRAGGRIIYYVEGMIMWKCSRIGINKGKHWALMEKDGSYTEHYKGFWHMCPACEDWQDWFAETCAEIVKTTGIDGFFIDSSCATYNHRCYNPDHHHPHPDVWNWGVRSMLRKIRKAVDEVNPEILLLVEGCADLAREYADGFVTHSSGWNKFTFREPLLRYLHTDMRNYESWSARGECPVPIEEIHLRNCVSGHRIYSHNPDRFEMRELSARTRRYYDAYPEIYQNPVSERDIECTNCISQLFEGPDYVAVVGNISAKRTETVVKIPVPCGVLYDRVTGSRIAAEDGTAVLNMEPWEFRAFEVRV